MESIALSINGKKVTSRPGATLLSVAEQNGFFIPTLCHHPHLKPHGACRMCLVEDEKSGRLMASCVTPAAKDMSVLTETDRIRNHRRNIVRLMMAEHPESCIVCSKGNRCQLRGLAAKLGVAETRLYPMPNYKPYEELNPFIVRDLSKCILCGKCIRADHDLVATGAIDYNDRGFLSRPATLLEKPLEGSTCTFCGTCVSMCPTGALSTKHEGFVGTPEKEIDSVCGFCGAGCSLTMGVAGDRIVEVNPAKRQGSVNASTLCVRGHFAHDFLNASDRLHHPLFKDTNEQGEAVFASATWDEAISKVAGKMADIKRHHGPDSIAFIGSPKCSNEENYLFQKIARVLFETNNIVSTGAINGQALLKGIEEKTFGTARVSPLSALEQADVILAVNVDMEHTVPVGGYHIKRAMRSGTPLIAVDIRGSGLASGAAVWLQPETGVAANAGAAAIIHDIAGKLVQQGLHDSSFVERYTDGQNPYSNQAGSAFSDPKLTDGIDKAVSKLAGHKIAIVISPDLLEQTGGEALLDALINLSIATGSIGAKNAGFFVPVLENNLTGALDMGVFPDLLPGRKPLSDASARKTLEEQWKAKISSNPGLDLPGIIEAAESGRLKGLYIMGENLIRALPDSDRVTAALKNLDFIVVQDIIHNRTVDLAHVVLPGAAFAEKSGCFTNMEGRIQVFEPAVPPPEKALPDWMILGLLAKKMGHTEQYNTVEKIRQEIRRTVDMYGALGNHRREWVKNAQSQNPFAGDGPKFAFNAIQAVPKDADAGKDYPFSAVLGSLRWHLGSGTRTARSGRIARSGQNGGIRLSPSDIAALGLEEADRVRIRSAAGAIECPFQADYGLPQGHAFIPIGFFGNDALSLASIEALNPSADGWRTCRVNIEKI